MSSGNVTLSRPRVLGAGLMRPESVLPIAPDVVLASDARGGVAIVGPKERTAYLGCDLKDRTYLEATGQTRYVTGNVVNGLTVSPEGDIVLANMGRGLVERLTTYGLKSALFDSIEGRPLGLANFVRFDADGDLWLSASAQDDGDPTSGYLAVSRGGGPLRKVADGIAGANEFLFVDDCRALIIAETLGRRLLRFEIATDKSLQSQSVFGPGNLGGFPDGITLDEEGALWGVLIGTDQIYRITPDGTFEILFTGGDADWFAANAEALAMGMITPDQLEARGCADAPLFTSLAFGGADLSTLIVGSLGGQSLLAFETSARGAEPPYWNALPQFSEGTLADA